MSREPLGDLSASASLDRAFRLPTSKLACCFGLGGGLDGREDIRCGEVAARFLCEICRSAVHREVSLACHILFTVKLCVACQLFRVGGFQAAPQCAARSRFYSHHSFSCPVYCTLAVQRLLQLRLTYGPHTIAVRRARDGSPTKPSGSPANRKACIEASPTRQRVRGKRAAVRQATGGRRSRVNPKPCIGASPSRQRTGRRSKRTLRPRPNRATSRALTAPPACAQGAPQPPGSRLGAECGGITFAYYARVHLVAAMAQEQWRRNAQSAEPR